MKKLLVVMFVFMLAVSGTAAAAPAAINGGTQLIGILDANQIMQGSAKIKALQEQLSKKGQELSSKLAAEKPKLTNEQYQAKKSAYFDELMKMKQTMELKVNDSIKQGATQVAKEKKLSAVVYKSSIVCGTLPNGIDITQDVLKKMR